MSDTTAAPEGPAPNPAPISDTEMETFFETRGEEKPAAAEERPAPADAGKSAAAEPQKPAEQVPLAALLEERRQRQQTERQMQELQRQVESMRAPPKPDAQKIPDFGQDPEKFVTGSLEQVRAQLTRMEQAEQQRAQQSQQERVFSDLMGGFQAAEQAMAKATPDYFQATEFIRDKRIEQLKLAGYSDDQAAQTLAQDVVSLAAMARQQGKNPAELTYQMAKTYGYTPKPAADENQVDIDAEKLSRITAGQKLASSQQGSGGSGPRRTITASDLSRMSAEQFSRYEEAHPDAVRRAMGG